VERDDGRGQGSQGVKLSAEESGRKESDQGGGGGEDGVGDELEEEAGALALTGEQPAVALELTGGEDPSEQQKHKRNFV